MSSVCNKCRHLWRYGEKYYCNTFDGRCKYTTNKKQCDWFEEGWNAKTHMKSTAKGTCWNTKRGKKNG